MHSNKVYNIQNVIREMCKMYRSQLLTDKSTMDSHVARHFSAVAYCDLGHQTSACVSQMLVNVSEYLKTLDI